MAKEDYPSLALRTNVLSLIILKLTRKDLAARMRQRRVTIGVPAFIVLRHLQHKPTTIRELGDHMMLAPATLVPIIDRLERKGLVKRGTDTADRRRNPISLTAKGSTLLASLPLVDKGSALTRTLEKMGPGKSRQLVASLEHLASMLVEGDDAARRTLEMLNHETACGTVAR